VPLTASLGVRMSIHLQPIGEEDEPFLFNVYASTRAEELALTGWSQAQQEAFLRMQYDAQRRSYRMQFPKAEYWVIHSDDRAAGRLIVERTAAEIHLIDIALLPEHRGVGIGTTVLTRVMEQARQADQSVRLRVERFNRALHWYQRLGFAKTGDCGLHVEMLWRPGEGVPVAGAADGLGQTPQPWGKGACRSL